MSEKILEALLQIMTDERDRLREALEMVRDADDDCIKDGLPSIPPMARAKIDEALAGPND